MGIRVTQEQLETVVLPSGQRTRVTQFVIEAVVGAASTANIRLTQLAVEAVVRKPSAAGNGPQIVIIS